MGRRVLLGPGRLSKAAWCHITFPNLCVKEGMRRSCLKDGKKSVNLVRRGDFCTEGKRQKGDDAYLIYSSYFFRVCVEFFFAGV